MTELLSCDAEITPVPWAKDGDWYAMMVPAVYVNQKERYTFQGRERVWGKVIKGQWVPQELVETIERAARKARESQ